MIHGALHTDGVRGSSTACVVAINGNKFQGANLGDSGFFIYRNELVLASESQQHSFNYPFQLSSDGDDLATDSNLYEYDLQTGDIIVVVSDGVLDNVYPTELQVMLNKNKALSSFDLAKMIAQFAFKKTQDKTASTPWHDVTDSRGKPDDIAVVVAKILAINNVESLCSEDDSK